MAYAVAVIALDADGAQQFRYEPPWWDHSSLMQDPRFRERVEHGYVDYVAVLTREEILQLHESFKAELPNSIYGMSGWKAQVDEGIRRLEDVFSECSPLTVFQVVVFEWESGRG